MKSDNAIRNGTSIFVGIIVAIAAFVRGALLLPLIETGEALGWTAESEELTAHANAVRVRFGDE